MRSAIPASSSLSPSLPAHLVCSYPDVAPATNMTSDVNHYEKFHASSSSAISQCQDWIMNQPIEDLDLKCSITLSTKIRGPRIDVS
jgi:hypothetical protein